ncbi:MAG: DEAD/DEAH box helicase family protein [Acidobacteria bacterium]|nr:DEAD/DEAH box helicase family protein [Acidobacteriota bacterium]
MESESEKQTRRQRIDPKLIKAGWTIAAFDPARPLAWYQNTAIMEYPTSNGPADYALCVDGQILGIVEAKKVTLGPQNVLTQAQRYSKGIVNSPFNFDGYHVPFLYSTNGEIIWFQDVRDQLNRSRQISGFHSQNALREMLQRQFEESSKWFSDPTKAAFHSRLRPYQKEAIQAIESATINRKRKMLVAMATGTGKTFTLVNQAYRLMKSGVAQRILFLVDRRALAAQAVRAFASFEPEPGLKFDKIYEVYSQKFRREDLGDESAFDSTVLPPSYLLDPKPRHAFVYVCTIQRMVINLFGRDALWGNEEEAIDDDAEHIDIPINAFDVIIADECHRGYTSSELSTWRKALDYFDSITVGLTATPAAHTKSYFQNVVYRYDYERAVKEGHLVDYDVVTVNSDVRLNGVFLKPDEQVGVIDSQTGLERLDFIEDEREFDATDLERKVTSPDSNQKIIAEVKKYAEEHEQKYNRFPKTLIFATNDLPHTSHADQLVTICRDIFNRGDSFAQKITGRVDRPLQHIREFRNRPEPSIVVSVDLLSTGVDIPDLEFIVFLRPVKSRILFEQMLGRGTRKGENYPDKSHFVVFDCFGGTLIEYFRSATAITADLPERASRTIPQLIKDIWDNRDRDYSTRCLVKRLQRIDKEMSGDGRDLFSAHVADGNLSSYALNLPSKLSENFTEAMKLLKDTAFQDLLVNYPRPQSVFYVAYETEDNVSSQWLVRDGLGKEHKPEDYLKAFERFVQENPNQIDAISILLNRPQNWGTDALSELQNKISSSNEHFTIANLQKAHEFQYKKALVDIISMVKHAAQADQPLFTAEERVNRAIEKVSVNQAFTLEQQEWLERIRVALVETLSIDREDFDTIPILEREGGWGKANRVFNGRLLDLIKNINEAIAA